MSRYSERVARVFRVVLDKLHRLFASLWARAGARRRSLRRLRQTQARKLLVLCYGNIYRSPFVEQVLLRQLPARIGWQIRSAGFHTKTGRSVATDYAQQARVYAVDLDAHRSRRVTAEDLSWADLILIMDAHNFRLVWNLDRRMIGKLVWLGACAEATPTEIQDPYGLERIRQARILAELHAASLALCERLKKV